MRTAHGLERPGRHCSNAAAVPTAAARRAAPAGMLRDPVDRATADRLGGVPAAGHGRLRLRAGPRRAHGLARPQAGRLLLRLRLRVRRCAPTARPSPATTRLRRALDCPDIDVLCSPISYFDRGLGQSAPSMTAAESVGAGRQDVAQRGRHAHLSRHRRLPGPCGAT